MNPYLYQDLEQVKHSVEKDARLLDRLTNSPDTPQLSRHALFQARHARSHLHQAVLELMRLQQILKGEAK